MMSLKRWVNYFDPGFGVVLLISLVAIWPFLSRPGLPSGTDAELHIFRLLELSHLIRSGEIYPRWAPDFYHGYGYPIFNYYAPLTYYLGLVVDLMPRLGPVEGVKAVFIVGMWGGAIGLYGFLRDNWGHRAGYVAASTYLYAPYIQYVDPLARGALAEAFSFGVFPLALWSLDKLRREGGRWHWISAVFTTAAVILSHNLMGLLLFGMLFAWVLWQFVVRKFTSLQVVESTVSLTIDQFPVYPFTRSPLHKNPLVAITFSLFLGLGLAAFFWLPVILERNAININTLIGAGDNYDFHTHFISWQELLAASPLLDWGTTEPAFRFNLGVAQWVLGGLGLVMVLLRRIKQTYQVVFFALSLALLLFLMLPASTWVWENVPFLPYFQFPWRLLGVAVIMLAVLAGVGAASLQGSQWNNEQAIGKPVSLTIDYSQLTIDNSSPSPRHLAVTAVFTLLPLLLGLPLSQSAPWPPFGEVSLAAMSTIEWDGRWLGTTSTSDYVPATVDIIPERNGQVIAGLYQGVPLDRVNRVAMPDGARVEAEEVRPLLTLYHVFAPKDFRLRLYQFDFPGWQVRIDGQLVETELARPEGFMVIPVPQGEHVIEVAFKDTPARTLSWWVSGVALGLTLLVALRFTIYDLRFTIYDLRLRKGDWVVTGAVGVVTAVHLLLLQPMGWLHYHSTGFTAEPAKQAVWADFGEQIVLIGYDTSHMEAQPGEAIHVTLYWKAKRPLDINFQVFVHLLTPDGVLVTQSDKINPGEFPTERWPLDKYVRDEHSLRLPSDLPPGEYVISSGLWVQAEGWRLPLLDKDGQQISDHFVLYPLTVR